MSRAIRTLGVGLLGSGWLFYTYQIPFIRYIAQMTVRFPYEIAVHSMSKTSANLLGMNDYIVILYTLMCLGAGFLIAGVVWPFVENSVEVAEHYMGELLYFIAGKVKMKMLPTAKLRLKADSVDRK